MSASPSTRTASGSARAGPDVVKVNVAEAGALLDVPTARRDDSPIAASKLRDLAGGDGHAGIVTRGSHGVMLAAPDGSLFEGVLYVRGRYPVGSGDAFLAGLVTALERGAVGRTRSASRWARARCRELPGAARIDHARRRSRNRRTSTSSRWSRSNGSASPTGPPSGTFGSVPPRHAGRLRIDVRGGVRGADRSWRDWAAGRWRGGTAVVFAGRGEDGALVGTATGAVWDTEDGVAHVYAMWVAPDARSAGVGRACSRRGRGWARDRGAARLVLAVTETNEGARRFYEACASRTRANATRSARARPPSR